jgi:3-hydroxyethyl bacteriochlorophyllide a dehydrogenase
MKTVCVVAREPNRVVVGEYTLREPRADEVVIATAFSTISPGTELRCLAGREPNAPPFPMITGYSLAGTIQRGAGEFQPGDRVFLNGTPVCPEGIASGWGGHIQYAIAPAAQVVRLPAGVDLKTASALSMLSIAMHGVCRAAPLPGDRVLVTGQGLIGLFAAALLRRAGCRVAVADKIPARLAVAARLGQTHPLLVGENWPAPARAVFPDGVDTLLDATGVPAVVRANLPLLRGKSWGNSYEPSPKLVLLASFPGEIALDYQETLFNKETEVVTCRTYLPHERERVLRLLATGELDVAAVLSEVVPVAEAPAAFRRLREEPAEHITFVLDWGAGT